MTIQVPSGCPNPYVGPRAFETGEKLYGRKRETKRLLNLLIAERIVLLYSPSGAGKTSLIQAALLPELEAEGFRVLPPMRPSLEADEAGIRSANRYVYSLLLSLEEQLPEEDRTPLAELANSTLAEYLGKHTDGENEDWSGDVLIFDQFEEILTVDPTDQGAKIAFFEQVGQALRDRNRWALFSMREEFVAGLDPYLRPIPTRFATTYRLELLSPAAAREAMQGPAADQDPSVTFTDAAATKLVDDLRTVRVQQPGGAMTETLGLHVEPVQMQVVCLRLWDRPGVLDDGVIDVDDLADIGDVDEALRGYYADTVAKVAGETQVRERAMREWVDRQLITGGGIRGQVLMGEEQSQGLNNDAIWLLVKAHLVRAEQRRGVTWFELAHDRLIEPVQTNNAAWFEANLSRMQRQADLWQRRGRPPGLLFRVHDKALLKAEQWAEAHEEELEEHEVAFLKACRDAREVAEREREVAEREREQSRRVRMLAIGLAIFAALATITAIFALDRTLQARIAEDKAVTAAGEAKQSATEAKKQTAIALEEKQRADEKAIEATNNEEEAKLQRQIAEEKTELAEQQLNRLEVEQLLYQARMFKSQGNAESAIDSFEAAAQKDSMLLEGLERELEDVRRHVATVLVREGEQFAANGKYTEAYTKFAEALNLTPPSDTPVYVMITDGEFLRGSGDVDILADPDEKPQRQIYLSDYWIGRTEVSNTAYARCVEAGACEPPLNNRWNKPQFAQQPVTDVDWFQANEYAEWVGGRLPTEAEWEKACRGSDGRIYPWSNEQPDAERLNYASSGLETWTDVGSYSAGANGLYDMAGNVWEWTADYYAQNYYTDSPQRNPIGPKNGTHIVLRGGSWKSLSPAEKWVRCAVRNDLSTRERKDDHIGFRIVIGTP